MSATRGFRVWRFMDAVVGMCICNDRRWPETYRVMGLQGVEIVALGYNTPIENIHHREPEHLRTFHHLLSLQAGAYQNATWVLAAAKCGAEDGFAMIGGSAIVAPTGEIAALALTEEDELITTTLDLDLGALSAPHGLQFREAPPDRALRADHQPHRRPDRNIARNFASEANTAAARAGGGGQKAGTGTALARRLTEGTAASRRQAACRAAHPEAAPMKMR